MIRPPGIGLVNHAFSMAHIESKRVPQALFFPLLFTVISPVLAIFPIADQGFVFRKNRRCLHDLAAGTSVVKV